MSEAVENDEAAATGAVWMQADGREQELVFAFPFDEELNEAVKQIPRRWFDWRRKHWRVPADPRAAKAVQDLLERFPVLVPEPAVVSWLNHSDRWRALVSVLVHEGEGAFVVRTLFGDPPAELDGATRVTDDRVVMALDGESADLLERLEGAEMDTLARSCARGPGAGAHAPRRRADGGRGRGR